MTGECESHHRLAGFVDAFGFPGVVVKRVLDDSDEGRCVLPVIPAGIVHIASVNANNGSIWKLNFVLDNLRPFVLAFRRTVCLGRKAAFLCAGFKMRPSFLSSLLTNWS